MMPILLVYMIYQDLLRFYLLIYLFDFQIVLLNFIILHDPPTMAATIAATTYSAFTLKLKVWPSFSVKLR